LQNAIEPGDVVWDIGANVGLYTKQFLGWTGTRGCVVAFEPFPPTFEKLEKGLRNDASEPRLYLRRVALSDKPGMARFNVELADDGQLVDTTAHLVDDSCQTGHCIDVQVDTVDNIRTAGNLPSPNVVKIDVEGFEEEVLRGATATFSEKSCRHLLIEVHFGRIEERGLGDAAARLVKMLKQWGFTMQWVDASHLHARR
jgi:FkbM family methyltransferase